MRPTIPPIDAERLPPYSPEAEAGLAGSILMEPAILDRLSGWFSPDHFFKADCRLIVDAAARLKARGDEFLDVISVRDELRRAGDLDRVGGYERVCEVADAVAHPENWSRYAAIIYRDGLRREAIRIGQELVDASYRAGEEPEDVLERAALAAMAITATGAADSVLSLARVSGEWKHVLERRRQGELDGLASGFDDLDVRTGGFAPGRLIVVGARPAMGKSAFALNVSETMARTGAKGLFVSQEMGRLELFERMVSSHGNIDNVSLRDMATEVAARQERIYREAVAAADRLSGLPLWIDDTAGRTVGQIESACRRIRDREGLSFLVVDYVQLLESEPGSRANRQEAVAKISRRLKLLAGSLRIPVICLSQLNRVAETREDKRPKMADLRESGAVEQDADQVLLLHRPEYYDPTDQPGVAEVIVAKNRFGPTGIARLRWLGATTTFSPLEPADDEGDGDTDF